MSKGTLSLLGIALIIGMLAANCFAQNNGNQQGQVKTIFSFKNEIGLTDDQEVKLKALLYDEQSLQDSDNKSLTALGAALAKMVEQKADMQLIKNKLEEIAQIQVGISCRNIVNSRKAETILTPDQLEKWKNIQKQFAPQARA